MARKSIADDMVDVFSRLPWWLCLILALISYLVLNHYSIDFKQPVDTTGVQIGTMGAFTVRQMYKTLAWFGKFLLPFIFCLAAIVSIIKSFKRK